jgi:hypothetical protein
MGILEVQVRRSWRSAFALAAAVELVLLGFIALIMFSATGADNPLPWVVAWLLQLPSSIIVMWLMNVMPAERDLTSLSLSLYAAVMFVGQTIVLGVWLRKPWRRDLL